MKKHAMTLAEILIALSIIGFISLLTIPALYDNFIEYTDKLSVIKANKTINETIDNLLNNSKYYTSDHDFTYTKSEFLENDLTKFRNTFKTLMTNTRPEKCYIVNVNSYNEGNDNYLEEFDKCFVGSDNIAWGIPDTDFTSETTGIFNSMYYLPIVVYPNFDAAAMEDNPTEYFKNNAIVYGIRRDGQIVFIDSYINKDDYPESLHHKAQKYIAGEN